MAGPQWAPDIAIDTSLAAKLVSTQFPELQPCDVAAFGVGWDNAAFLVDGKTLFRFPRRRRFAGLIEREVAILPLIAPLLPISISAPSFVGAASIDFPFVFAGYPLLAGETACSISLSDADRGALAVPLGRFLRALHGIDSAPLVASGLPPDGIGRLDGEKRLKATRERLPALRDVGLPGGGEAYVAWLERNPPVPLGANAWRLVHGDLYARHLLLDVGGELCGVIDWGDVHLGDPALDIAIAHLFLPSSAHAAFRAAYGSIDDRTWSAARYRALYHALLQLEYGLRENDRGMRDSGYAALRFIDAVLE